MFVLFWAAAALLLVIGVVVRPIDHDESQYVAATVLAATLRPYRDFAYLQTPLQPLLLSPISLLFRGHVFAALRFANAAAAFATLVFVYRAQRSLGVSRGSALVSTMMMICCEPLLFAASTARNDSLPAAFSAAALFILVRDHNRPRRSFLVGAGLTAAATTKISYALLLAVLPILSLRKERSGTCWLDPWWAGIGMALAAIPVLVLVSVAPAAFLFEVVRFPVEGPAQWYRLIGEGWRLGSWRFLDFLGDLAMGPALLILAILLVDRALGRRSSPDVPAVRAIDVMLGASIAAALLPNPIWRQYLVPILPPLFIRAGVLLDDIGCSRLLAVVTAEFAGVGLLPTTIALSAAVANRTSPLLDAEAGAHALGHALRLHHPHGAVGGLSPELFVDSGYPIDPRFAAGPFLFRTHGMIRDAVAVRFRIALGDTLSNGGRMGLPEILVTGGEGKLFPGGPDLDAVVERFASTHGYRPLPGVYPLHAFVRTRGTVARD